MIHRKPIRILPVILALTLLLAFVPQLSLTADAAETSGKCGDNLTWSFNEGTGRLTITGSGEMKNWSQPSDNPPWYPYHFSIRSISLPSGLKTIGDYAFNSCYNLTSAILPDGVTSIGQRAFAGCYYLTELSIPDSVTSIGEEVFYGCERLEKIFGQTGSALQTYAEQMPISYVVLSPGVFVDVPFQAYYAEPVRWAAESGVTTGTSADRFSPDSACTRAQVVTFLWRAENKPAPTKTDNPFKDVGTGQYYTDAVLWAVEKGVTKGTSADKFSPDSTCTRGQIVTFLYRAME